jgi:anti-sigma factor RsiW
MNCETFLRILADYQENALAPERRREAEAHLAICEGCRSLVQPDAPIPPDLAKGILARTTGSACRRLKEQAAAHVDGELDGLQSALVEGHLEHCPQCAALVSALREISTVLPSLAMVDPGPIFTRDILAATSRNPAWQPAAEPFSWQDLGERLVRLLRRPRIAFEAAYVGTLAGFLFVSYPGSQISPGPGETRRLESLRLSAPMIRAAGMVERTAESAREQLREIHRRARQGGTGFSKACRHRSEVLERRWKSLSRELGSRFQRVVAKAQTQDDGQDPSEPGPDSRD